MGAESVWLSVYKCCADLQIHGMPPQSLCLDCPVVCTMYQLGSTKYHKIWPLQERRLPREPALVWPPGCNQNCQFRKLPVMETGKEQVWQCRIIFSCFIRVLCHVCKLRTKHCSSLCFVLVFFDFFWTCIFFISKFSARIIRNWLFINP